VSTLSPKTSYNIRALATQLLGQILSDGRSLSVALPHFRNQCQTPQDAAFLQALIYGVLRFYPRLCFVCDKLLQKPIKTKEIDIYYLAVIGLYQLMFMSVAPHAIISETVEAARVLNKPWATGLINAILRNFQRQSKTLLPTIDSNEIAHFAHPRWLLDEIKSAWPTEWQTILTANNEAPPLSLRVNQQKITRDDYLKTLQTEEFPADKILGIPAGITLKTAVDITKLPGFNDGLFSVQDGAAQFAAELLALKPNLRVLDACAAPGGKTTHILEKEPNLQALVAIDIAPTRTALIQENLSRLHLSATVITADANKPHTWWDHQLFDRILLDAPCSATGVIRRHPDIKYLRQPNDIVKLALQQKQLLQTLWPLLAPNGLLLYATCSLLPAENSDIIEAFLTQEPSAKIVPISLPVGFARAIGHQILPGQGNLDGFYYALLTKA